MSKFLVIHTSDNVAVALRDALPGDRLPEGGAALIEPVGRGHKCALRDIAAGEMVVKYGFPIGHTRRPIAAGAWVHTHNLATNLAAEERYEYHPSPAIADYLAGKFAAGDVPMFAGYRRPDGRVGVRNEVWVIPTVGCVNSLAERLAKRAGEALPPGVDAVVAFPHPYGCSQLGDDHEYTRTILADLARHPNAGAVLLVGLGCENNGMDAFLKLVDPDGTAGPRLAHLVAQEEDDEFAAGMERLEALARHAAGARREPAPVSELRVGLKCGGSDGLSGITANPLLGAFSDWLVDRGGGTLLSEVPEMFGAERGLLDRAVDADVFARGVEMVNGFKRYFLRHGQTVYENPSPGNKAGGISTLEDKSLGCTQKGGRRPVADIIPYGGVAAKPGLTLLAGPGNDIVAVSALAAAGAQLILFTTGRGTPLGSPVPVVKVSSNTPLAEKKRGWIDFDAGPLAGGGEAMPAMLARFAASVLAVAGGVKTRNERNGCRDFAIFKDGVTL